jgi:MSHA pilin protein MshC
MRKKSVPAGRRSLHGFTMIELVVTMVIIGILAIAVLPRMDLLRGYDEIGFRDQIRTALEFARKSAVAQRRYARVTVAGNTLTAHIASGIPEGPAAQTFDRPLMLPGENDNQLDPPGGVTLTPDATLIFDPLGRYTSAVPVTFTVSGAGDITVEAETGYVH